MMRLLEFCNKRPDPRKRAGSLFVGAGLAARLGYWSLLLSVVDPISISCLCPYPAASLVALTARTSPARGWNRTRHESQMWFSDETSLLFRVAVELKTGSCSQELSRNSIQRCQRSVNAAWWKIGASRARKKSFKHVPPKDRSLRHAHSAMLGLNYTGTLSSSDVIVIQLRVIPSTCVVVQCTAE